MSKYSELFDITPESLKKDAVLRFPGACSENNGIVISCGCAMKAGDYAKKLGATKVAIIADKIIIQLGMLAPITDSLDAQGIAHCYFCDIAPEPHTDDLLAAEKAAREKFYSSDLGKRYYQLRWGKDGFSGDKFEFGWSKAAKETLLHELQHAIQKREGSNEFD